MTDVRNILYGWMATLILSCCTLFVVSCSSDDPEPEQKQEQGDRLQLVSCTRSNVYEESITDGSKIQMLITSAEEETKQATFVWNNPSWSKDGKITEGVNYYLYGVLSGDNITPSVSSTDYSLGATLTVNGLSPLALEGQDPCVIVGVEGTTNNVTLGESDVHRGQFSYVGQAKDHNYVHLLLDRLYSAVTFQFGPLDAEYASLRTIKLTRLDLKMSLSTGNKLNMTVPLTANTTDSNPIGTITASQSETTSSECTITLFEKEEGTEGKRLPVEGETHEDVIQASDILVGCFAPDFVSNLSVVSYYDVYDKGETPYKLSSRTAENALGSFFTNLEKERGEKLAPGEKFTLTLTVNPTYLYQLSDPDATTIKISAN